MEGFLILPYSGDLLESLYLSLTQLGESEIAAQRLTLAKFMFKAGGYLGEKPNFEVDLGNLFRKYLKVILNNPGTGWRFDHTEFLSCMQYNPPFQL